MSADTEEIELGYVSGVFGVKGEVRLFLHNRQSVLLDQPLPVVLVGPDGQRRSATCRARSGAGKRILGQLSDVVGREAAAALKDWRLVVKRSDLPEPDDDEFYVVDVEGLPVRIDGQVVGEVLTVHATDGGDVFELIIDEEGWFVPAPFVDIDLDAGFVGVDPEALE